VTGEAEHLRRILSNAPKAQIIGLANAGGDTINSIKQASEFGIVEGGQKLAGMLMFITDVKSLGLDTAKGLSFTTPFYWNRDEATRTWSKRFAERCIQRNLIGSNPPCDHRLMTMCYKNLKACT